MSNKKLFANIGTNVAPSDAVNNAGGKAYSFDKKHCLAQIAATNTFNGTYYVSAEDNLKLAKDAALALKDSPEFIAKVALYARDKAYMKDMPAFLTVVLSEINKPLFRKVFRKVVDNGKMLRNVIQMARSGAVTSKKVNVSSGSWRHAIQEWFDSHSSESLFKASIGNDPSMRDILRMAHPKPNSLEKEALFGYFVGKEIDKEKLPQKVRLYEAYKTATPEDRENLSVPDVDFRMLDSLGIGDKQWLEIARKAPWMMTRMNLNTFARHNVFKNNEVAKLIADRLSNKETIAKAKAFPYQLYTTWMQISTNPDIPSVIKEALQDAMEVAIDNVPLLPGMGYVCVDTSGSMSSPITGQGYNYSSIVKCSDVAGLIASAVFRKNKSAEIYTFDNAAQKVNLNPRDTVFTNTKHLSKAGGGTNISAPLRDLNQKKAKGDWVLYVSDCESWVDNGYYGTGLSEEWKTFKTRNPHARLVCCDLTPRNNSQINTQKDVLQVGGFSDQVFDVVATFLEGHDADHWVRIIEEMNID